MQQKHEKTDAQRRASAKWEGKHKQRILRLTPEKDAALVKHAEKNKESINSLLNRLIDEELQKSITYRLEP